MEKLNFRHKTILVTGASSGIGKEFAIQLAAQQANLILTARTEHDLVVLAETLKAEHPSISIKIITADLSEQNAAQKLYAAINEMQLSVDYLINNAGFGQFGEFISGNINTYHKMLTLNIIAVVELSHLLLPAMKEKDSGGIINVASISSFQPLPYYAVYAASKAFVLSFSEALSGELLHTNLRIMALCPGATESHFMEKANADTSKMNLMPAEKVVNDALRAFAKNKMFTVSGTINYLTSLIPRIVSRKMTVKIIVKMFKKSAVNNLKSS